MPSGVDMPSASRRSSANDIVSGFLALTSATLPASQNIEFELRCTQNERP
jgi:hypothetical protein